MVVSTSKPEALPNKMVAGPPDDTPCSGIYYDGTTRSFSTDGCSTSNMESTEELTDTSQEDDNSIHNEATTTQPVSAENRIDHGRMQESHDLAEENELGIHEFDFCGWLEENIQPLAFCSRFPGAREESQPLLDQGEKKTLAPTRRQEFDFRGWLEGKIIQALSQGSKKTESREESQQSWATKKGARSQENIWQQEETVTTSTTILEFDFCSGLEGIIQPGAGEESQNLWAAQEEASLQEDLRQKLMLELQSSSLKRALATKERPT